MDAGHAPENGTSQLRRFEPQVVLLVDAAEMGEQPGTIRLIEMEEIDGMSASTHSLPLSMLANYLVLELGCQVAILGIQPASTDVGEDIDPRVFFGVQKIVNELEPMLTGSLITN
jgi:hydrogenase 3 maturation protease